MDKFAIIFQPQNLALYWTGFLATMELLAISLLALGVLYATGLMVIGLELGLLIGVLAGLASIVPYLGVVVGIGAALTAGLPSSITGALVGLNCFSFTAPVTLTAPALLGAPGA